MSKQNFRAVTSPKKRTDEFFSLSWRSGNTWNLKSKFKLNRKTTLSICFSGEVPAWQFWFEICWSMLWKNEKKMFSPIICLKVLKKFKCDFYVCIVVEKIQCMYWNPKLLDSYKKNFLFLECCKNGKKILLRAKYVPSWNGHFEFDAHTHHGERFHAEGTGWQYVLNYPTAQWMCVKWYIK